MAYLLDTNALGELDKPSPNPGFMSWFAGVSSIELYVSCITVGEIYKGIGMQKNPGKKRQLLVRTEEIIDSFDNRALALTVDSARIWAELIVGSAQKGQSAPTLDALIAAHALQHQLILVTRNIRDFERFKDLQVLNPWTD